MTSKGEDVRGGTFSLSTSSGSNNALQQQVTGCGSNIHVRSSQRQPLSKKAAKRAFAS
jgi:hypothetical protein